MTGAASVLIWALHVTAPASKTNNKHNNNMNTDTEPTPATEATPQPEQAPQYDTHNPPDLSPQSDLMRDIMADSEDVVVDLSEPQFHGVRPLMTLADITPVEGREENAGEVVLLVKWALEEPATDVAGKEHPAGTRLTDRILERAGPNTKSAAVRLDMGRKTKAQIIKAAQKLSGGQVAVSNKRLFACKGQTVRMKLTVRETKDKKTGELRTNQNFYPVAVSGDGQ